MAVSVTLGRRRLEAKSAESGFVHTGAYRLLLGGARLDPTVAHARWATAGLRSGAVTPPAGGAPPLYWIWRNRKLGKEEAWVLIYVPMLAESVLRAAATGVDMLPDAKSMPLGAKTMPPDINTRDGILCLMREFALKEAFEAAAIAVLGRPAPAEDTPPDFAPLRAAELRADLALGGTEVHYRPLFLGRLAARVAEALRPSLPWRTYKFRKFGRDCTEHKQSAFFGDPGTAYSYLGQSHPGRPWAEDETGALRELLYMVSAACGQKFNFVLCNLYSGPRDSLSAHSDDVRDLVPGSPIASVSVGMARPFVLEPRSGMSKPVALTLESGSLVVMGKNCQQNYKHSVPPVKNGPQAGWRMNFTFRRVK